MVDGDGYFNTSGLWRFLLEVILLMISLAGVSSHSQWRQPVYNVRDQIGLGWSSSHHPSVTNYVRNSEGYVVPVTSNKNRRVEDDDTPDMPSLEHEIVKPKRKKPGTSVAAEPVEETVPEETPEAGGEEVVPEEVPELTPLEELFSNATQLENLIPVINDLTFITLVVLHLPVIIPTILIPLAFYVVGALMIPIVRVNYFINHVDDGEDGRRSFF